MVRHGDVTAVDGIDFTVHPGEVVALLGPNGAGKTSTVEVLEGYRPPDGGTVRVLGLDPFSQHSRVVPRIGVMLQEGGVATAMRPVEALELHAAFHEDPRPVEELLDLVGLRDRSRSAWRTLSGGEQQRLSLALALVGRPEVLFLDEPTAGIDPGGRRLIRGIVAELSGQGLTTLLTTHDLDEAERLADRVVIIDHGRVVATGTPGELRQDTAREEVLFAAPPGLDVSALRTHLGAEVVEVAPGEYKASLPPSPANVAKLTAWLAEHDLPLADLRAGRQSLEDVFLRLTTRDAKP